MSLFDLDDLTYCGEGNNTIVVSNVSRGCIMRIHKTNGHTKGHHERKSLSSLTQVAANPHIYRCFGSTFTRQMHLVQTTPSFLKKLEQKIAPYRPEYRKVKGIDHSELFIIVAPDAAQIPPSLSGYSYGPTISVEIKPKFGAFFLWPSTGQVHAVKSSSGLFCLSQNHSSKQSLWQRRSDYCPCDMFSGDRNRMARSLWALVDTPQINLRILLHISFHGAHCHLDTKLIFSCKLDHLEEGLARFFRGNTLSTCNGSNGGFQGGFNEKNAESWCKENHECVFSNDRDRLVRGLLLDALLHELDSEDDSSAPISVDPGDRVAFSMNCRFHRPPHPDSSSELNGDGNASSPTGNLPPDGSILGRVLATQLLSRMDICFVVPHYERVCKFLKICGISWDHFVSLSDSDRAHLLVDSPEMVESFDVVEKYLIALVARDCSIMISLRRALPDCPTWVPTVGGTCVCIPRMIMNATIIDLDPKPVNKIRDRLSVEESIVKQTLAKHPWLLDSICMQPQGTLE